MATTEQQFKFTPNASTASPATVSVDPQFAPEQVEQAVETTTPVGVISSQQGKDLVTKQDEKLGRIEFDREDMMTRDNEITNRLVAQGKLPKDQAETFTRDNLITNRLVDQGILPESQRENVPQKEDKVTFINPETGAEQTLRGDALTSKARQELENQGFVVSESDVAIGDKDPEIAVLEQEAESARNELQRFNDALEDQAISSKELRSTIRSIQKVYGARIDAMEEINNRRQDAVRTLGVRLGSRYTGGSGGVFGGVIAEEERQGLERINTIEAEMQAEIENAKTAAREFNFTLYSDATDRAKKLFKEKKEAVEALKKVQAEEQAKVEEEAETIAQQSQIISQVSLGLTDPTEIFTALGSAVPFDAIKEITDSLPDAENKEKEFVKGTKYQPSGTFDPATGEFTPLAGIPSSGGNYVGVTPEKSQSEDFPTDKDLETMGTTERDFVNKVMRQLPTKLKDSEQEKKDRMKEALFDFRRGRKIQEVVDELNGYVIQNEKDAPLANIFRSYAVGSGVELAEISAAINNGNPEQAMTTVENAKLATAKEFFGSIDEARTIIKLSDTITSLLEDIPVDKLGAFDGRAFKVSRFAGLTDKEQLQVQQLETALQTLNSPVRVSLIGTAGTEQEMAKITALQADIIDQPAIIKTKVEQFRDGVLDVHNQARSQRGLPTVNKLQLTDNDARLELYRSKAEQAQEAVLADQTNTDLIGSITGQGETMTTDDEFWNKY